MCWYVFRPNKRVSAPRSMSLAYSKNSSSTTHQSNFWSGLSKKPSSDIRFETITFRIPIFPASALCAYMHLTFKLCARFTSNDWWGHRRQTHFEPVCFLGPGCDDPGSFEPLQAVSQDVRRNTLSSALEFLEAAVRPHHQIADDQQRPAISKPLEADAHRAVGAAFRLRRATHARDDSKYHL